MARGKRISQTLFAGLLGLAVLVGLNVLAAKQDWRIDVTADQRNTLTLEAVNALKALDTEVTAYAFYLPQGDGREFMEEQLELFARETENFTYEFVDPDAMPLLARELGVTQTDTVVLVAGDKHELLTFPDEEALVNGLVKVSDPRISRFVLVKGHGELDPDGIQGPACQLLRQTFEEQGVEVEVAVLADSAVTLDDADAVLILGPQRDFLDVELDKLTRYFRSGGRVFIALAAEEQTNIEGWMQANLGVERRPGLVVDEGFQYPLIPLGMEYGSHPVTQGFNVLTLYPTAAALVQLDTEEGDAFSGNDRVTPLVVTSQMAYVETDLDALVNESAFGFDARFDEPGPLMLAAAFEGPPLAVAQQEPAPELPPSSAESLESMVEPGVTQALEAIEQPAPAEPPAEAVEAPAEGAGEAQAEAAEEPAEAPVQEEAAPERDPRAVVFGDQDFLADDWIATQGNLDMARNAVNWLLERDARIAVTRDQRPADFLMWSGTQLMIIVLVPFVVFLGFTLTMVVGSIMRNRRKRA